MADLKQSLGERLKRDFPILVENPELVYLDSAASAQKPQVVLDALLEFYSSSYANIHRGVYPLSERATGLYEKSREIVAAFIKAKSTQEIIFTRGATESINLVSYSWGRKHLTKGAKILLSVLEHHSNIVPWQLLAKETGAEIEYVELNEDGSFSEKDYLAKLDERTKLVSVTHIANGLGVKVPLEKVIVAAHQAGAKVLIDAAQSVAHEELDVVKLNADFLVFSGHKIFGPTGIGVLYGKKNLLEEMPPFQGGGDMIRSVSLKETTFNELPFKFEAGTPHIAGAIGLGRAIQYVSSIGFAQIMQHENELISAIENGLTAIKGVKILGPLGKHHGLVCFTIPGIHPHDIAQFLAGKGIAIRAGHHCAQPLIEYLGYSASARASVALYNTKNEIEIFIKSLEEAKFFFK